MKHRGRCRAHVACEQAGARRPPAHEREATLAPCHGPPTCNPSAWDEPAYAILAKLLQAARTAHNSVSLRQRSGLLALQPTRACAATPMQGERVKGC